MVGERQRRRAADAETRCYQVRSTEIAEGTCRPAIRAGAEGTRGLRRLLARVVETGKHSSTLKTHHGFAVTLIETPPDSNVDVCIGRGPLERQRVIGVHPVMRVAACEAEVEQPRAGRRGEAEHAEACEARPAGELRSPLALMERNRVGRGVLRRSETGRERERQAKRQARREHSGLLVRARRLTIHGSDQIASLPTCHCEATRPASSSPTITLATALPTWSSVAQRAPRVEASRTMLASDTDTTSIPIIVPAANAAK